MKASTNAKRTPSKSIGPLSEDKRNRDSKTRSYATAPREKPLSA